MPFDPLTAGVTIAASVLPSLLSKKSGSMFNQEAIDVYTSRRLASIDSFSQALSASRAKYLANLNNLQNLTMQRFAPNLEAQYAGRGLNVGGGAFASALAKKSAELQAQGLLDASTLERADLTSVGQMRDSAYAGQVGQSVQYGMNQNTLDYGSNAQLGNLSAKFLTPEALTNLAQGVASGGSAFAQFLAARRARTAVQSPVNNLNWNDMSQPVWGN